MAQVRRTIVLAAGNNVNVDLSPFDRYGLRGGSLSVKATCLAADAGKTQMTILIGSDTLILNGDVAIERDVGVGPDDTTQAIEGFGLPSDPVTINVQALAGHSGDNIVVQATMLNL